MRPPWWWCVGWSAGLLVWTVLLLLPVSPRAVEAVGGPDHAFAVGKSLHVGVYALLALTAARPWRGVVLVVLLGHAATTEYLQQFTGRGSSWRDVGLDSLGILLGLLTQWVGRLGRRAWRRRGGRMAGGQLADGRPSGGREGQPAGLDPPSAH